jgi:hypothetical protein
VLSNKAVNTARVGYASYGINQSSLTTWSNHWQAATGSPTVARTSRSAASAAIATATFPRYRNQNTYTIHDDFTYSYDAKGHQT